MNKCPLIITTQIPDYHLKAGTSDRKEALEVFNTAFFDNGR